jgi:hypothetical protein
MGAPLLADDGKTASSAWSSALAETWVLHFGGNRVLPGPATIHLESAERDAPGVRLTLCRGLQWLILCAAN